MSSRTAFSKLASVKDILIESNLFVRQLFVFSNHNKNEFW